MSNFDISVPLDEEGFLRRECPSCEKEFKIIGGRFTQEGSFFCPYCTRQSGGDSWWTQAQLAYIQNVAVEKALGPAIKELQRGPTNIGEMSGGLLSVTTEGMLQSSPDQLVEPNDMRKVEPACHPDVPLKVFADGATPVHCFVCGTAA